MAIKNDYKRETNKSISNDMKYLLLRYLEYNYFQLEMFFF